MPRMTERERLADLEARQKKVAQEIDQTRRALRGRYAAIVSELPIEFLTERELRDILTHAIRGWRSICRYAQGPAARHNRT